MICGNADPRKSRHNICVHDASTGRTKTKNGAKTGPNEGTKLTWEKGLVNLPTSLGGRLEKARQF